MKKSSRVRRGFTLIELLVVIAIIGILSAVVLASLNTARTKGKDAAVEADLQSIRSQAEVYYNNNNYVYGTSTNSCTTGMFTDTSITNILANIRADNNNGTAVCNSTGAAYAVETPINSSPGFWCIDSSGNSKTESAAIGTATACP
jgi:prepilin-type N-terminal cleavage/methylation domain-containing protein